MTTKYGFNDGEMVPAEAEAARTIIIEAGRAWLKKHRPELAVDPYDRPGCHNWCLVHFHPVDDPQKWVDAPPAFQDFLVENLDERFNDLITINVKLLPQKRRAKLIAGALAQEDA